MELTCAGERLLSFAADTLHAWSAVRDELAGAGLTGLVRIVASTTPGEHLGPELVARFLDARPGVSAEVSVADSAAVGEQVLARAGDIGFSGRRSDDARLTHVPVWHGAMEGIRIARELGLPIRVRMTEVPENADESGELRALLAPLGVTGGAVSIQPLVQRGKAEEGLEVFDDNTVPELTVTADGLHWHPAGGDVETSPDMWLASGDASLAEGKRLVTERFLALRQADGALPTPYACAV